MKGKGISPLIAAVLLIAVAVGIAAAIGPTIISFVKEQVGKTTQRSSGQIDCSKAGIYVRDAVYNTTPSPNHLKLRVENTGYVELTNFRVDVIFANKSSKTYTFYGSDKILPTGSYRWYVNESVSRENLEELVVISGTCPQTGRYIISNSSISWV